MTGGTNDTPRLLLTHHLKSLRLPTVLREHDRVARPCAAEGVDHTRHLLRLAGLELVDRERRMVERRIKGARFPTTRSLDSLDFKAMPSLDRMMVIQLARCDFISQQDNVIAVGNSGTGKTHVAIGPGHRSGTGRLSEGIVCRLHHGIGPGARTHGSP